MTRQDVVNRHPEAIIDIMIDGGERLCDHAISQWTAGKYLGPQPWSEEDEQMRQDYTMGWLALKREIRPLARRLKQLLREEGHE